MPNCAIIWGGLCANPAVFHAVYALYSARSNCLSMRGIAVNCIASGIPTILLTSSILCILDLPHSPSIAYARFLLANHASVGVPMSFPRDWKLSQYFQFLIKYYSSGGGFNIFFRFSQ